MKRQEELKKKIVKIVHAFCITCTCMDTAPTLEQAQTFPSYTPFVLGLMVSHFNSRGKKTFLT